MMVIGHKSVEISNSKIRNVVCPHCLAEAEMNYTTYSKYVHFYWFPFVPVEKIKIVECTSCKATFYLKDTSESIQKKVQNMEEYKPVNFPIYHFSGLFLILLLFAYFYFSKQL